jgi:hypothetical protein
MKNSVKKILVWGHGFKHWRKKLSRRNNAMLKFVNKNGEKVLELKDTGDITFVSEDLKKQGLQESVEDEKEDEE